MSSDDERKRVREGRLDAVFQALPKLGSPEYLALLNSAPPADLPPQVLVRAYRQLIEAGESFAADRTLERLLGHDDEYRYLRTVRWLAWRRLGPHDRANEVQDLVLETVKRMVMSLPTSQGAFAERAWVEFSRQQFEQAWRDIYARTGWKADVEFAEPVADEDGGTSRNLAEESEASDAPWHTLPERPDSVLDLLSDRARFALVKSEIESWSEPLLRAVAIDQFLEDPSAVSGARFKNGKPSLEVQLGIGRDEINRLKAKARTRLKAALLSRPDLLADMSGLAERHSSGATTEGTET